MTISAPSPLGRPCRDWLLAHGCRRTLTTPCSREHSLTSSSWWGQTTWRWDQILTARFAPVLTRPRCPPSRRNWSTPAWMTTQFAKLSAAMSYAFCKLRCLSAISNQGDEGDFLKSCESCYRCLDPKHSFGRIAYLNPQCTLHRHPVHTLISKRLTCPQRVVQSDAAARRSQNLADLSRQCCASKVNKPGSVRPVNGSLHAKETAFIGCIRVARQLRSATDVVNPTGTTKVALLSTWQCQPFHRVVAAPTIPPIRLPAR